MSSRSRLPNEDGGTGGSGAAPALLSGTPFGGEPSLGGVGDAGDGDSGAGDAGNAAAAPKLEADTSRDATAATAAAAFVAAAGCSTDGEKCGAAGGISVGAGGPARTGSGTAVGTGGGSCEGLLPPPSCCEWLLADSTSGCTATFFSPIGVAAGVQWTTGTGWGTCTKTVEV
mmetsp:Transcript_1925/g.5500  ORF Transcript_1925/g.5500 Transcript_1925/m.5500 type:complete len:172 (+) Transcript_1925:1689-2204(+)